MKMAKFSTIYKSSETKQVQMYKIPVAKNKAKGTKTDGVRKNFSGQFEEHIVKSKIDNIINSMKEPTGGR